MQNHKPVVSVCQKASGSLPKDLSKTNLDPHCGKCGTTDRLFLYVTILSKAAFADNKNPGPVDLSQWTKASSFSSVSMTWRISRFFPQLPKLPPHHLAGWWLLYSDQARSHLLLYIYWDGRGMFWFTDGLSETWIMSIKSQAEELNMHPPWKKQLSSSLFVFYLLHETNGTSLFVSNFQLHKDYSFLSVNKANTEWDTPITVICGFYTILPI